MIGSWLPDELKKQILDAMLNFAGDQGKKFLGDKFKEKINTLSSHGALQKALNQAVERGIKKFEAEYIEIDEDLTSDILQTADLWHNKTVRQAIITIVSKAGLHTDQEQDKLTDHFEAVLPNRRNRERVDRALTYLLRTIAEEVWTVPAAKQIRELYSLQFQRLNTETAQQQLALLRSSLEINQQLSADIRNSILQLSSAIETKLLAAPQTDLPVLSPPRPWHNLPQRSYTQFIGREEELSQLKSLMQPIPRSRHYMMVVDGIGGVGKSVLALELAYFYRDNYHNLAPEERFEGIIWVSAKRTVLSATGIMERSQIFNTLGDLYREIAQVLQQPKILQLPTDQQRGLIEHLLITHRTLLVVDNLETVDDPELLSFLRELPEPTKCLVTTRHRIDIAYAIRLTGMIAPDAIELIALEARNKQVTIPLDKVESLYHRTGGIPLAIVWSIGLMSLGHSIDSVIRKLGSGQSDITRFCFEQSVKFINQQDSYKLLLGLALFEYKVSRSRLGMVCGMEEDEFGRDEGLARLVQLSLVNQQDGYFHLLPLTRGFALAQLESQAELEKELRNNWMKELIELAQLYFKNDWQKPNRPLSEEEGQHLVTLARWCQENSRSEVLLKIFPGLAIYYDQSGQWANTLTSAKQCLEFAQVIGDNQSIVFICSELLVWILGQQGHFEQAEVYMRQALEVSQSLDNLAWQCNVLVRYAQLLRRQGRFEEAKKYCDKAFETETQTSKHQNRYIRADIELELGRLARDKGEWQTAWEHFSNSNQVFKQDEDVPGYNLERAWSVYGNLGYVTQQLGDLERANQIYKQVLEYFQTGGSRGHTTTIVVRLASLEAARGNYPQAKKLAYNALIWSKRLGMVKEQVQAEKILRQCEAKLT